MKLAKAGKAAIRKSWADQTEEGDDEDEDEDAEDDEEYAEEDEVKMS